MKNWILNLVFLPSIYVSGNATVFGPDSYVDISDHFPIKVQLPLQGDKSLTQITIERRNLDRINIEIFKSNINLTLNSDRINTDNLTIHHMQIIEDRTKLIITPLLNNIDIQATKVRKLIKLNKQLTTSPEINIWKRKKRRSEEKLILIKRYK